MIRLGAIGDVIQTLPTLKQLQLNFSWRPKLLGDRKKSYPILEHQKGVNFFNFSKRKKIKNYNFVAGYWHAHKFKRTMQSLDFDLAIDLQGLFKSDGSLEFWSSQKIGFNPSNTREGSHVFLNEWLPKINPKKNAQSRLLSAGHSVFRR